METLGDVLELNSYNYQRALGAFNSKWGWYRRPFQLLSHVSLGRIRSLKFNEHPSLPVSEAFFTLCSEITQRSDRPQVVALHAQCESTHGFQGTESWILANLDTLAQLSLRIGQSVSHEAFLSLLQASSDRLPMLQILQLDAELEHLKPGQRLELSLGVTRLCAGLRTLTTLHVTFDIVDQDWRQFVSTLSRLPALREIHLSTSSTTLSILARDAHQAPRNGFSKLQLLDVSAPPYLCVQALQSFGANVSAFAWKCPRVTDEKTLQHTLAVVASSTLLTSTAYPIHCPSLSTASINSLFMPYGIPTPVVAMSGLTDVRITIDETRPTISVWHSLQSLFSAHAMRVFKVCSPYSLYYTSEDLEAMFQAWPEIRHLSLNPRPSKVLSSSWLPPLGVLSSVATSAPCLEIFEANLDGAVLSPKPLRRWETNVVRLDLGMSVGPESVTELLSVRSYVHCLFKDVQLVDKDCSAWVQRLVRTETVVL